VHDLGEGHSWDGDHLVKLTQKLIGYLNRVFDKGPGEVLALRLRYDGSAMTWRVADGMLTTTVVGGTGVALSVNLASYTVAELGVFLAAQPGYSVPYQDLSTFTGRSALVLLDGSGDQDKSNGDHLIGFTSVLWAYMDSIASELTLLRASIAEAIQQMSASTASDEWVDEHGTFYKVTRNLNEVDSVYAARIVAEVIKARGNNVAIAEAIKTAVLADSARVVDYDTITTATDTTESYGLFDVTVESSVDVPMAANEDALVRQIIEAMRDAGTFLRTLKYIRKMRLNTYMGAYTKSGHDVLVTYLPGAVVINEYAISI